METRDFPHEIFGGFAVQGGAPPSCKLGYDPNN